VTIQKNLTSIYLSPVLAKAGNNAVKALESVYRKWEIKQQADNTKSI
jgi:hypothetical protein